MEVSEFYLLALVKVQMQTWKRSVQLLYDNQIITKIPVRQLHNQSAVMITQSNGMNKLQRLRKKAARVGFYKKMLVHFFICLCVVFPVILVFMQTVLFTAELMCLHSDTSAR